MTKRDLMRRIAIGLGVLALICAANAIHASIANAAPRAAGASQGTDEFDAQQTRPRITIHPRVSEPGPNSKRYCRSWLAQEYRVSGTVIVPRMQCWWQ
jgi:hypothetical protein